MRFKFLTGDVNWQQYGGKWISPKCNNGDFDYWLVLEFINWEEAVGQREAPAKYHVSLSVVSPSEAGEEGMQAALDCCGIDTEALVNAKTNGTQDEMLVEALHGYGISAPVWQQDGNNARALLAAAKKEADSAEMLFGFYMDRPMNAIGATGWDFVRGDITRPLREA